jgi:hypothetical protein
VDQEFHTADVIVWVRVKDIDPGQCDKGVRVQRPREVLFCPRRSVERCNIL